MGLRTAGVQFQGESALLDGLFGLASPLEDTSQGQVFPGGCSHFALLGIGLGQAQVSNQVVRGQACRPQPGLYGLAHCLLFDISVGHSYISLRCLV